MKLGFNGVIYFLTGASGATGLTGTRAAWTGTTTNGITTGTAPTGLTKVGGVIDSTTEHNATKIDASSRDVPSKKVYATGRQDEPISFKLIANTGTSGDAGQNALFATYLIGGMATIPLAILDGPSATAGSEGEWADYCVTKFQKGEPEDGLDTYDVEVCYGVSSVPPQHVIVGSGS